MPIDCEKADSCATADQGHCPLTFGRHCSRHEPTVATPSRKRKKERRVLPAVVVVPPPPHQGERWQVPDYPHPPPIKGVTIKTIKYTVSMIVRECVGGKWEWTNVSLPKSIAVTAMENSNPWDVIKQGLEENGESFAVIQPINHRILCFMEAINGGESVLMSGDYKNPQNCFETLQANALGDENTHRCWFVTVR